MAANLGVLTLDLVAKTGGFTGPLDKAGRQAKKTSDEISKYGKAMGAAIGAGAVAAAAGVALIVNRQRELIDQQAKAAQMLDTTYSSLTVLGRAGELAGVGMEKIETASRQLNLNLGRAVQGSDSQVKAFERLGLKAQEIYDLPLDQRIAKINQALRDNVQASERAAVAAEIYGAKNAKALQQLDPDTIAEANRQAEIFGIKLSEVDAAKVEMANDALSTFGLAGDGIAKQLTVELAPILKVIGERFLKSAEEAGGLGTVVKDSAQKAVNALAFLIDAGDGVKRVFELVSDSIIVGFSKAASFVANNAASILNVVSYLPGVDYSDTVASLRQFAVEANGVATEAMNNIDDTLNRPLAGEAFKQFYKDAQAAAEEAAKSVVKLRNETKNTGDASTGASSKLQKSARDTRDAVAEQISALERAAKIWGMSANEVQIYDLRLKGANETQLAYAQSLLDTVDGLEKQKEAQEAYKNLVADLRTDEERLTDQLRQRLSIIEAIDSISNADRKKQTGRAIDAAFSQAPTFGGSDASIVGPAGEFMKLNEAQKQLDDWYKTQLEMLGQFRQERADLTAEWDEQELELKRQHEEALANIEKNRQLVALSAAESTFGSLADMAKTFAGEQSALYKTMFIAEKAAAIARATLAIQEGIALAAANPFPANLAAMATVAAATAGIVGNIAAIGMAHDGIDSVPKTGTWILEKGERVTTAETSAKLDATLAQVQAGISGGGTSGPTYNIAINQPNVTNAKEARQSGASVARDLMRAIQMTGRYT